MSVTFVLGFSRFRGSRADAGASRSPEPEYADLRDRSRMVVGVRFFLGSVYFSRAVVPAVETTHMEDYESPPNDPCSRITLP